MRTSLILGQPKADSHGEERPSSECRSPSCGRRGAPRRRRRGARPTLTRASTTVWTTAGCSGTTRAGCDCSNRANDCRRNASSAVVVCIAIAVRPGGVWGRRVATAKEPARHLRRAVAPRHRCSSVTQKSRARTVPMRASRIRRNPDSGRPPVPLPTTRLPGGIPAAREWHGCAGCPMRRESRPG